MKYDDLETARLKLRMWRESDLDDYAELSSESGRDEVPDDGQAVQPRGCVAQHRLFHAARVNEIDVLVYGMDRP